MNEQKKTQSIVKDEILKFSRSGVEPKCADDAGDLSRYPFR